MKKFYLLVLSYLFCQSGFSQTTTTITLEGNPLTTTGWTYAIGTSSPFANTFILTQAIGSQAGDIYYDSAVNITALCNQFTVDFDFQIIHTGSAADGMDFWYISNTPANFWNYPSPAPIDAGWPQGEYLNIPSNPNGMVLIFDTWDNDNNLNNPLATVMAGTGTPSCYQEGTGTGQIGSVAANQTFITDGGWHHCKVIYNNGTINVYFNNSTTAAITGNYTLNQAGYFGFSGSTGGSDSKQSIRNVVISNAMPAPIVDSATYCQYAVTDTLTPIDTGASVGATFTWYDASGNLLPGSPAPNTSAPGTTYYYVSQQKPGACLSPPDTVQITVTPQPGAPVITGDTAYCYGTPFAPFSVSGQNNLWYTTNTGGVGSTTAPTVNTSAPGTYTYYASQNVTGCESARDSISVHVHQQTPVPAVVTPVTYCQQDVAISLTGNATGSGLLWYTNPPSGAGSSVAPTPSTAFPGITNYYVSQTIDGCQGDSTPVSVVVKHKPTLSFDISNPQVCLFNTLSLTYTGNASSAATFNWTLPPTDNLVSGSGAGPLVVSFNSPGLSQINFNVTDSGCASNDTTIDINVMQSPAPTISFLPDNCIGLPDIISFDDTSSHASTDTYYWVFNGASAVTGTGAGPYNVTWDATGPYNISLSVVVSNCASDTTTDVINVHPSPDVHIAPLANNDICTGDSVELQASTTQVPVYAYQWMPFADFASNNSSDVYGVIYTPGFIYVKAISDYGCVNTDSVAVNVHPCCDILLPNAFSPNGDSKNDVFRIIGLRPQKIVDFRIEDRWGKVVYSATDERGWDGTINGTPQDVGTYYYSISYICADGKEYQKKGDVILVR